MGQIQKRWYGMPSRVLTTKILVSQSSFEPPFRSLGGQKQTNYLYLGNINEDYLRELLTTMGDRFTDDQVDDMFREAPIDQKTCDFNYIEVR